MPAEIPFRVETQPVRGYPCVSIYYQAATPGSPQSYWGGPRIMGPPLDDPTPNIYRDSLCVAIVQLINQFRELEKETESLRISAHEAMVRALDAESELKRINNSKHPAQKELKRKE